jgi:hypothetical protein
MIEVAGSIIERDSYSGLFLINDRFREYLTVWRRTGKKEDSFSQLEGSHAGNRSANEQIFSCARFDLFSSQDIFRWRAFLPRRLRLLRSEPPW